MYLSLPERRLVKEGEEEVMNWAEREKLDGESKQVVKLAEAEEDAMKFERFRKRIAREDIKGWTGANFDDV